MAEEEIGTDEDIEAQGDATKTKASMGRRAYRNLRRARAVLEENSWEPSNEAAFLVQEANVLVLMDLADAIRGREDAAE